MNLSPQWVQFLGGHGIKAVHWSEVGEVSVSDQELFNYAADHSLILITHDLDFGRLLAILRTNTPSVIQLRSQEVLPSVVGDLVIRSVAETHFALELGALVTIDPAKHRIRLVPITR